MAPASDVHGTIQSTLAYLVTARLRQAGSRCRGRVEAAVVPRVRGAANLRVPDFAVTCAPASSGGIVMPDPILIVEILSPGNESDTRENVWAYTTIPSVREILVLHSTRVEAEILRGSASAWPENPDVIGTGQVLRLDSVELVCGVNDLYSGTHLA